MTERQKPLAQQGNELKELVLAYFKQETTDELKGLAGYVAFGLAAWLLIGIGVMCVSIGVLRLLQTETDVFDGNWSWAPYFIVVILLGVCAFVTWKVTTRRKERTV